MKNKIFKTIISILVAIIVIAFIIYLFPMIQKLANPEAQSQFKAVIDKLGIWGILLLLGIQLLKIFLIIIPAEPIEILSGMCYGAFWGTIFIIASAIITTTIIMLLVRWLGRKFVYRFFSKERIDKIENSKMFKNPKRLEWIIILLFIIPGTPKDVIVYLAALLPINPYRFIAISVIARIPSIISSTLAGANLATGNWHISLIIYAVTFAIIGIVMFIVNRFDKSKATEDVLESIK